MQSSSGKQKVELVKELSIHFPFEVLGSPGSDERLVVLLMGVDHLLIGLFVQFGTYSAIVLTGFSLPLTFLELISLLSLLIDNGGMTTEEKRHSFAVLTAGALMGLFVTEIVKEMKGLDGNIKGKVRSLAAIGISGILTGLVAIPRVHPELFVWFLLLAGLHLTAALGAFSTDDLDTLEIVFVMMTMVFGLLYLLYGGKVALFSYLE